MQNNVTSSVTGLTRKQRLMLTAPILLTLSMYFVFQAFTAQFGASEGYVLGFIFYWAVWCIAIPIIMLKPSGVAGLYREANPRFGKHPALMILIIGWPIVLPFATFFVANILSASLNAIILSVGLGVTIGVTEELFWRGVYTKLFPGRFWLGYIYPAVAFGFWHLAPLSVQAANVPGGVFSFVLVSVLLGLSWGYSAYKTGSIRWCTVAHVVNDTLGLGGLRWIVLLAAFL